MSKTHLGDVKAYIPSDKSGEKATYIKIGSWFRDNTHGGLSIKIDSLPFPGSGWKGWVNLFPLIDPQKERAADASPDPDGDIPF